jgi:competence protein ComGC
MEVIVNRVVPTVHLILLRHQVAVGAAIGMLMALVVVQVAAQVVLERAEVEQQGKEAMVGMVARQVATMAQAVVAAKTR